MKNIYRKIENPLVREGFLDELLTSYCKNSTLYRGLIKTNIDKKIIGRISTNDVNDFYIILFNEWKKAIHTIRCQKSQSKFNQKEIESLDNYLQSKNPKTAEEIRMITQGLETDNQELKKLLNVYRWDRLGEDTMWEHIDSSYVKIGSDKIKPIEHRLYINCDSSITHLIMKEFIRKCNAVSSKYYFKYDIYADRSDTLVIYSDTKHLAFYIKLLNEIVNENNLSQGVHAPPLLTGRINSFIGYGSEPLNTGTSPISFNSKREIHLEKCIKAETADFIRKNFQRKIRCNNSLLLYKDYLIGKIISAAREDLLKYVTDTERIKYIKSEEFAIDLARKLAEKIDTILKYYKNNCTIQIQVPTEGNPLRISHTVIEDVLKTQIRIIFIKQETYKESLMQRIKDSAHEFDIDKDNYAVDISKSQLLGKDVEDDFDDSSSMQNETKQSEVKEKPKIKIKNFNYNAMTDEEIEESRKKIGIK